MLVYRPRKKQRAISISNSSAHSGAGQRHFDLKCAWSKFHLRESNKFEIVGSRSFLSNFQTELWGIPFTQALVLCDEPMGV